MYLLRAYSVRLWPIIASRKQSDQKCFGRRTCFGGITWSVESKVGGQDQQKTCCVRVLMASYAKVKDWVAKDHVLTGEGAVRSRSMTSLAVDISWQQLCGAVLYKIRVMFGDWRLVSQLPD
jgi:hypothetical protein